MMVNSIIAAMVANAGRSGQPLKEKIYQVGSSLRNPNHYFSWNPWINKEGKAVDPQQHGQFSKTHGLKYMLLLKGLEVRNAALCNLFHSTCVDMNRKIGLVMHLIEIYRPYLFFEGFDDMNTERLRNNVRENGSTSDANIFYFDSKWINWDYYLREIHLVGLVTYVFKSDILPWTINLGHLGLTHVSPELSSLRAIFTRESIVSVSRGMLLDDDDIHYSYKSIFSIVIRTLFKSYVASMGIRDRRSTSTSGDGVQEV
ncbi:hypothetical protein SAY86_008908 [Trapa natans]|uniref:Fatty acyl-CoA reductase C-terminal domain-containing protein n=1 Tax=Trapa natans TaxID=22666 RepID=A0AAN7K9G4_TRANT|nr:hypothetical protein SAY86_008908 [Trapa natans]